MSNASSNPAKKQKVEGPVRLTYFNSRGLAELPRLCLAYAGVEYEDVRVEKVDEEFKASGKLAFGQVPLLEINGMNLVQSFAIARYLARKFGFYGSTVEEEAQIDSVMEGLNDIRTKWYYTDSLKHGKDEAKKEFFDKFVPLWLDHFEQLLTKSGTGFYVGDKLSLADIQGYNLFWNYSKNRFPEGTFDNFPKILAHVERIGAEPKIAAWVAKRPVTEW